MESMQLFISQSSSKEVENARIPPFYCVVVAQWFKTPVYIPELYVGTF